MAKKISKKPVRKLPVRSQRKTAVRFSVVLLPIGVVAIALSFALSLVWSPALIASAEGLYDVCHDHLDNNGGNGIDMLDPACAGAENSLAVGLNQELFTGQDTSTTTVLTGEDDDSDILYFSVSMLPSHGTLTCAGSPCVLDEVFGSTLEGGTAPGVTYTPAAGYVGDDEYDFTANDGSDTDGADPELVANQDATITIHVAAPAAPACSGDMGAPIIDVTQAVSNDPDSGTAQTWATDQFSKHIRVWAEGDHYCGQTDDTGTFATNGTVSPEHGDPLPSLITGTFTGEARYVIRGSLLSEPEWPANGDVPANECGDGCPSGTYSKWIAEYFASDYEYDYAYWHWTYEACGHGSWTNADTGNTGDIVEGPTEEECSVPDDQETPPSGDNGAGSPPPGIVDGGGTIPSLIGVVTQNPGNGSGGGLVLGTSTEASNDGLPAGCSAYLDGYLRMGGNNNPDTVKKLQTFLNAYMDAGLPVTGVFGPMTFEAVEKFQVANWEKVLKPWVPYGLPSDHTPTGYVYKTTKHLINLINCSSLDEPEPQLP